MSDITNITVIKPVLVYYINVSNVDENNVSKYVEDQKKKLEDDDFKQIFIPINGESRVECLLNPIYTRTAKIQVGENNDWFKPICLHDKDSDCEICVTKMI